MARPKITMEKQIRNTEIYNGILKSIGGKCTDTASVYVNGKFFAHYSREVAMEVFDDIKGKTVDVVSDVTGEILKHKIDYYLSLKSAKPNEYVEALENLRRIYDEPLEVRQRINYDDLRYKAWKKIDIVK